MGEWKRTSCVLCGQNCGLEAEIEENRIVKVRGDKENPRSEGYVCRKGMNVAHSPHHAQRLTHPLKRLAGPPLSRSPGIRRSMRSLFPN